MKENTAEPALPRVESPAEVNRRKFLEFLSIGLGGVCTAILGLPVVGFLLAPFFRKTPEVWRTVGQVGEFEIGKTVNVTFLDASPLPWAGVTAKTAAWLRRVSATEFIAFAVNCSHLGCPVRWLQDAELFMCPCHGGVYYGDGSVAAGPPPKPLSRYRVRIMKGEVQILSAPIPITS
jgi:menaquinol-cytochrome c reductase iron-sulfur subunit